MSKENSHRRGRRGKQFRQDKQEAKSCPLGKPHHALLKKLFDNARFFEDYKKQVAAHSAAVDWGTDEGRAERLVMKLSWKKGAPNPERLARYARRHPMLMRALMRQQPGWALRQERIADSLSRLVWCAHHGSKSEANMACDWLKWLLLEKKVGGGSLDRSPAAIRKWFESELARVNVVLSDENRILIRADWQELLQMKDLKLCYLTAPHWATKKPEWASRPATGNDKVEAVRRQHERRCNPRRSRRFRWVELDDIYCVIDREHQSNRAYVVERAATAFQTTTSDIEKKLKRYKPASAV